ncbi:MAG: antibiotic biosynthesis monooxygenase, partial [Alphaproteobacteria bacterium]
MLHVVATLPLRPDKAAEFEKVFTALAAKVRAEEKGYLRYDL